jgi:hypothetical protein
MSVVSKNGKLWQLKSRQPGRPQSSQTVDDENELAGLLGLGGELLVNKALALLGIFKIVCY